MIMLRLWMRKFRIREKSSYLLLLACYVVALFLPFGPFLKVSDSTETIVLKGFQFLVATPVGNFAWMAWIGLFYILIIIGLCVAILFWTKTTGDEYLFWVLVTFFLLGFFLFGIVFNYYCFTFQFGTKPVGVQTSSQVCAWLFDVFLWVPFIPFFLLRNKQLGGRSSQPIYGTNLDETPNSDKDKK